jgi:hypothetical protein
MPSGGGGFQKEKNLLTVSVTSNDNFIIVSFNALPKCFAMLLTSLFTEEAGKGNTVSSRTSTLEPKNRQTQTHKKKGRSYLIIKHKKEV